MDFDEALARARAWVAAPNSRPEPMIAKTVASALVQRIDTIRLDPVDAQSRRERVARAICSACGEKPEHSGDARGNDYRWQDYLDAADAAIAAY